MANTLQEELGDESYNAWVGKNKELWSLEEILNEERTNPFFRPWVKRENITPAEEIDLGQRDYSKVEMRWRHIMSRDPNEEIIEVLCPGTRVKMEHILGEDPRMRRMSKIKREKQ